jgi:hypothetical protein
VEETVTTNQSHDKRPDRVSWPQVIGIESTNYANGVKPHHSETRKFPQTSFRGPDVTANGAAPMLDKTIPDG